MPFVAAIVGATAILAGGASVAPPTQPGPWTQVGRALTSAKPGKALHFYRAVVSPKAIGVVAGSSSVRPIRVTWYSYCEFSSDDGMTEEHQGTTSGIGSV